MIVRIARVKVGNRQAPQQVQKPHPEKVGFLRWGRLCANRRAEALNPSLPQTFRRTRQLQQKQLQSRHWPRFVIVSLIG